LAQYIRDSPTIVGAQQVRSLAALHVLAPELSHYDGQLAAELKRRLPFFSSLLKRNSLLQFLEESLCCWLPWVAGYSGDTNPPPCEEAAIVCDVLLEEAVGTWWFAHKPTADSDGGNELPYAVHKERVAQLSEELAKWLNVSFGVPSLLHHTRGQALKRRHNCRQARCEGCDKHAGDYADPLARMLQWLHDDNNRRTASPSSSLDGPVEASKERYLTHSGKTLIPAYVALWNQCKTGRKATTTTTTTFLSRKYGAYPTGQCLKVTNKRTSGQYGRSGDIRHNNKWRQYDFGGRYNDCSGRSETSDCWRRAF
jgi:hypothetical protein